MIPANLARKRGEAPPQLWETRAALGVVADVGASLDLLWEPVELFAGHEGDDAIVVIGHGPPLSD